MADVLIKYNYLERIGNIFGKNCLMVRKEWYKKIDGDKHFVLIATDREGVPDFSLYTTFNEAEEAYFEHYTKLSAACAAKSSLRRPTERHRP